MNPLLLRTALITGVVIGLLNIVFAALDYGLDNLPLWFYAAQLLLLPAMILPMRYFPQASVTRDFLQRAGLFALGWAVPFAIYKFAHDVLNPVFDPVSSLISYVVTVLLFSLIFAAIRRPKAG
ncbi:hypothetical protein [Deinococcus multiflagellatus]|uniref:Uncharacterized protein n=1 Tax=Deinococcus multiflagellatus TaxID=1656887 RepID=A0ABW1ZG92_9DEIO|nr:hypothetical protein [Deinococcus multiflagellatus]MBZ9716108.1 hypothetical protein [Deinococcus multiflagellatus]